MISREIATIIDYILSINDALISLICRVEEYGMQTLLQSNYIGSDTW